MRPRIALIWDDGDRFALGFTAERESLPHCEHPFQVINHHLVECPALIEHYTVSESNVVLIGIKNLDTERLIM